MEQIERRALAEMTMAPHVEDASQIRTPEVAVAEFHAWLADKPTADLDPLKPVDRELYELIGVR